MSRLQTIIREIQQGKTLVAFLGLRMLGEGLTTVGPLVVASRLSPATFGSYTLAKMVLFLFLALLVTPSQTPFIVLASQERQRDGTMNKTFSVQLAFFAAALILFVLLTVALRGPLTAFAEIGPTDLLFVSGGFIGIAVKIFLSSIFMATDRRVTSSLVELVFGASNFLGIILLSLAGRITLQTVFATYLAASALTVVLFAGSIDFRAFRPLVLDRACLREMLAFTKWAVVAVVSVYFINSGDNLVLRYFVSMEEIGVYNLAYQVFKGVATPALMLNAYFLPFVSQHVDTAEKMRIYLFNKRPKIVALGVACIALLFTFAPSVLEPIYGDRYAETVVLLRVLLVGCVLALYGIFYEPILCARKAYSFAQAVNIAQLSVNLGLDILLVPRWGALGAAMGTVLGYLVRTLAMELYFRMKLKRALD